MSDCIGLAGDIPRGDRLVCLSAETETFSPTATGSAVATMNWSIQTRPIAGQIHDLRAQLSAGHYAATNTGPITHIIRADIATTLVDQLEGTTFGDAAKILLHHLSLPHGPRLCEV